MSKKYLGFGGLGDCFIIILKLLEQPSDFVYTHIDTSEARLKLSGQLLQMFGIRHNCVQVQDIRSWWNENYGRFDKCFNVFAKGYIDIPRRPYHWQPCVDEGYTNPYGTETDKDDLVVVQVNSGGPRSYKTKPVITTVLNNFDSGSIIWIGTDTNFTCEHGTNYVGKTDLIEALDLIARCEYFIGFPSVMLYWALYNRNNCFVFTDHQGRDDLRIHTDWRKHLEYERTDI